MAQANEVDVDETLVHGLRELAMNEEIANVDNNQLHDNAQEFLEEYVFDLEYDPHPHGMAGTVKGARVREHRVLFVFLGPSDPAIEERELADGIWNSFKTAGRWLRTMRICNDLLQLASSELKTQFPSSVSDCEEVFMMDLFPWKRWAAGGSAINYSKKDKELAKKWFRRQRRLIRPRVVIFFNSFGNEVLSEEGERRLSTSQLSIQFRVDTHNVHYAVLRHPGALRMSPFSHVEDYLKTFIAMNFLLNNGGQVPPVYFENAIAHFRQDDSIISVLRATRPQVQLTLQEIRDHLTEHNIPFPTDGPLRLSIQAFQLFDGQGRPVRRGRAYLYVFPPVDHADQEGQENLDELEDIGFGDYEDDL